MARKSSSGKGSEKGIKFEAAMKRLEEIVAELEKEYLDLEKSLSLFEEGIRMSRICSQQLDQAEKKIEKLVEEKDGEFQTEILQEPEENNDDRESADDELPF